MAMPHPQAPPNVTLVERLAPQMSDRNPLDRAGAKPLGSNVGVQGDGFVISPRRLTAKVADQIRPGVKEQVTIGERLNRLTRKTKGRSK